MMMAFRLPLLILVVSLAAMAMVVHSGPMEIAEPEGHGLVDDALEMEEHFMMESETARRQLAAGAGYISYGALKKNNVPCNQRGQSYYNCRGHQKANPYQRGCTRATKCARNTR